MARAVIGIASGLSFEIAWDSEQAIGTAAETTRGALRVALAGTPVWATQGRGFSWTWIELLEHLGASWRWIEWEEIDPLNLGCPLEWLRSEAEQRWENAPGSRRDDEEEQLWSFERRHNLASGVQGAWLRDLWLLRCGDSFRISSADQEVWQDKTEVLASLGALGDEIASRLSACDDPRAKQAVLVWRSRRELAVEQFISTVTSLRPAEIDEIARGKNLEEFWELRDQLEPNEILAAARMAGPLLAPAVMRTVIDRVRRLNATPTAALDRVIEAVPPLTSGKPFDQGYQLAIWLRTHQGKGAELIEPEDVLRSWKVEVRDLDLPTSAIDAICCWGPRHGPAIFINGRGNHAASKNGRRATLAHEICHLVVDRRSALPLTEVLGGRVSRSIEARARAFAAEFLLPREAAVRSLRRSENAKALVKTLARRYGVSAEIVAWQLRNSGEDLTTEQAAYFQTLVREPSRF